MHNYELVVIQAIATALMAFVIIIPLYYRIGIGNIGHCMGMWLDKKYWTDYNTIEFFAWFAKGCIIIPSLIFHFEIWYLHFFTLVTSSLLIWASMKKSLPTLLAFNTVWIVLSSIVIVRNIIL